VKRTDNLFKKKVSRAKVPMILLIVL
jgi:hypothetical protein